MFSIKKIDLERKKKELIDTEKTKPEYTDNVWVRLLEMCRIFYEERKESNEAFKFIEKILD